MTPKMEGAVTDSAELAAVFKFVTSLAIGLLLGLQRERTPGAKAGLRTFALVALLGTALALVADAAQSAWIIGAGLATVGIVIIAAYHHDNAPAEADSGTTTAVAMLLCFGLGVMVWYDYTQLAVAIAIAATVLLHFKTELHGFSARISQQDLASILQFAVLSFIVLPLLPDRGFGPYGSLNPYHIWLMVVLVSGVGLAGYLALRYAGGSESRLLVGALGGVVSSTATTLVHARQGGAHPAMIPLASGIIGIAQGAVLVRLALISAVVAPGALSVLLPVLASGLAVGAVPLLRQRAGMKEAALEVPEFESPTNLRIALGFGALYALMILGAAWLSDLAGSRGLYALAVPSGLLDVDAITLSSLRLMNNGTVSAAAATTAVAIAYASNTAVKLGIVLFLGGRGMLARCAPGLLGPILGVVAGLLLFA
ncbi:MAG: MgtC/SapB family protein [Burkholderiales bacterium]